MLRQAFAKLCTAEDTEDEREEREHDGGNGHDTEEQPFDERPPERRRREHGAPTDEV